MKTGVAVLVCVALASASVAGGGDAKAELKKFEGTWEVESTRGRGKDIPAKEFKGGAIIFTGDQVTIRKKNGDREKGTFKIDPGKKPPHIDFKAGGETTPGIYAFKGGKLTLCLTEKGERPTEFESP